MTRDLGISVLGGDAVLGLIILGALVIGWILKGNNEISKGWNFGKKMAVSSVVGVAIVVSDYFIIRYSAIPTIITDPIVELAIGEPFGSHTLIIIKNSGIEPVVSVSINLRCFLLERPDDPMPVLFFTGFPSIGNANSWWTIDVLGEGEVAKKESMDVASHCLKNAETRTSKPYNLKLFAADLSYGRQSDHRQYKQSALTQLLKENDTGNPFTWPVPMSDYHRHILRDVVPPSFRAERE
jgi:hypothetical protein